MSFTDFVLHPVLIKTKITEIIINKYLKNLFHAYFFLQK